MFSRCITTNTAFSDWGNILYNTTIATAIADRLVENSEIFLLGSWPLHSSARWPSRPLPSPFSVPRSTSHLYRRLQEGDNLDITLEDDKIIIKPVLVIDRSQSWFWSKQWQEMEKEADEDIEQGRVQKAKDVRALMDKLDS